MFHRIAAVVRKEFIQLFRDWMFLFMILFGAPAEMGAVAYATGQEITNLPLAVCDYDRTPLSRELVQTIANVETFNLTAYVTSTEEITTMLDSGEIYVALVIPPQYSTDLISNAARPEVQVVLNGAESAAAEVAFGSIEGALMDYSFDLVPLFIGTEGFDHLEPSVRVWYNEDLREANYTIPSELGFMLYVIALWVAVLSISRERELGTLEQLMVTPITKLELVIGKSIPAVVVAYINFFLMLALTVFVFKVPMRGSLLLLAGLAFFYILVELQRGLLISVLSRSQQQGLLTVFLMAFLDMTFAGYAVPVESMPPVFQFISNLFPIRHWMIIMRGIMLKGAGLEVFWTNVVAIAVLGTILLGLTLLTFSRALGES